MAKRMWGLFCKDLTLSWRNYFFAIELVIVLVMAALYHFVLPDEMSQEPTVYVSLEGAPAESLPGGEGALAGAEKPNAEVIFRGHESERTRQMVMLALRAAGADVAAQTPLSYVDGQPNPTRMPFRRSIVPVLLLAEPALLGFVLIATLVFFEKEEGTALTYMVSPGTVWAYLASKVAAITVLSLFSATVLTGLTVFADASWGWILLIVAAGSIFGSAAALLMASFFDTLTQAMAWITVVSVVIGLPMVSYFAPSIAPLAFRLSPAWPLMWGLREAFLPNGSVAVMAQAVIIPLAVGVVCIALAGVMFRRRLVA